MRPRRIAVNVLVAHAAATVIIMALIVIYGNATLTLAALMMFVIISMVGWFGWHLVTRLMPAEEAFEIGYQAGYRDGRRAGSLKLIDPRRAAG